MKHRQKSPTGEMIHLDGSVNFCNIMWLEGGNLEVSPNVSEKTWTCLEHEGIPSSNDLKRVEADINNFNLTTVERIFHSNATLLTLGGLRYVIPGTPNMTRFRCLYQHVGIQKPHGPNPSTHGSNVGTNGPNASTYTPYVCTHGPKVTPNPSQWNIVCVGCARSGFALAMYI